MEWDSNYGRYRSIADHIKEETEMKKQLKVLMLNGSPKAKGNTSIALQEMEQVFHENNQSPVCNV